MIKEIKYDGYTAQPSDYDSPDGDLALSLNLIPEESHLAPLWPPALSNAPIVEGAKVEHIHTTAKFVHYIAYDPDSGVISYSGEDTTTALEDGSRIVNSEQIGGELKSVSHFNAIGNTLIAFTPTEINYFLWADDAIKYVKPDGSDGYKPGYKSLGTHIPDLSLSFGLVGVPLLWSDLQGDEADRKPFEVELDKPIFSLHNLQDEGNINALTEGVLAKVNKLINDYSLEPGLFMLPFFVRYALRLYDGSLVCHSAPILMNPCTTDGPFVFTTEVLSKHNSVRTIKFDIMAMMCQLDFAVCRNDGYGALSNWKDIVTGVEIYISKPIYLFDSAGKIKSLYDTESINTKFIGRLACSKDKALLKSLPNKYCHNTFWDWSGADKNDLDTYLKKYNEWLQWRLFDYEGEPTYQPTNDHLENCYAEWSYRDLFAALLSDDYSYPTFAVKLPEFNDDQKRDDIESCSNFYFLKQFTLEELEKMDTERHGIEVEPKFLQTLTTRRPMTDDYHSHDQLAATISTTYNSRLNLAGISRSPYRGYYPDSMFAYCTSAYTYKKVIDDETKKVTDIKIDERVVSMVNYEIEVLIKDGGHKYKVACSNKGGGGRLIQFCSYEMLSDGKTECRPRAWGAYVFYPDPNAYRMIIRNGLIKDGKTDAFSIDLKPHDFLNGAYAFIGYEQVRQRNFDDADIPSVAYDPYRDGQCIIPLPGKVYTSEVNNPFYFPVTGINTIGTNAHIIALATAAKALSEGQFGQFPLYAFTDDGVWAMELSSTGTYLARQPITRDVCLSADSITQIDSAVLFATSRGIMMLSGSQATCITDVIGSDYPFGLSSLPGLDSYLDSQGLSQLRHELMPFSNFIYGCRMIYDYPHQHIIVFNPKVSYAYVYSLKSNMWGMMYCNIAEPINSYPEALAVDRDRRIVDFSKFDPSASSVPGLLITRPLKLDAPDILKTVDTIIQRGYFHKGHVQSVLYGSRDLIKWHLVWSSKDHFLRGFRGTPYKYFRIALICNLEANESITGASIQFTPRKTNQLR